MGILLPFLTKYVAPPNAAPTNITLSASSIAEDATQNTDVGTLTVTDADDASWDFAITDNTKFQLSAATGATSKIQRSGTGTLTEGVDETVTVQVTDSAANTYQKAFTVSVTAAAVNQAPTAVDISGVSLPIDAAEGTKVATITVTDADSPGLNSLTFSNAKFQVANIVGKVADLQVSATGVGNFTDGVAETGTFTAQDDSGNDYTSGSKSLTPFDPAADLEMGTVTIKSTSAGSQSDLIADFMFQMPQSVVFDTSVHKIKVEDPSLNVLTVQEDLHHSDATGYCRLLKGTVKLASALSAGATVDLTVTRTTGTPVTTTAITVQDVLDETANDGFDILVTCTFPDGSTGTASAREALQASTTWDVTASHLRANFREGPLCTEMICSAPIVVSGTPDSFLRVHFHLSFYKAGTGAWNVSTNPIIGCKAGIILENSYKAVASPVHKVYDLLVEVGNSAKTTVYELDGAAGDASLTLSATSGKYFTATRAAGTWATPSATPNSNDLGKALVETAGSGRAIMRNRTSGTVMYVMADPTQAFASTSLASGYWKTMGVFHPSHYRVDIGNVWWGTEQEYVDWRDPDEIKASCMVPNYAAATAVVAPKTSVVDAEGAHPMAMQNGLISDAKAIEDSAGGADHIGVIPYSQVTCLLNWNHATDYADARRILRAQARVTDRRPWWHRDEDHGGLLGIDQSGNWKWSNTSGSYAVSMTDNRSQTQSSSSGLQSTAKNHTGNYPYLAYVLFGELRYLEGIATEALTYNITTTDYGYMIAYYTSVTVNTSTDQLTATAHDHYTGEEIRVQSGGAQIDGASIANTTRHYIRVVDADTIELYDTYAHALASPSTTGRRNFTSAGSSVKLANGYAKSGIPGGAHSNQARQVAWGIRSYAAAMGVIPDNLDPLTLGRGWSKTEMQRYFDNLSNYCKTTWVDDTNYVASGPRFLFQQNNDYIYAPWMMNMVCEACAFGMDLGVQAEASDFSSFLDWCLAASIQMCVRTDASPEFMVGDYYSKNRLYNGTTNPVQYTWEAVYQQMQLRNVISTGHGHWPPSGVTADISDVSDQSAVTVTLKKAGVDWDFFDMTNSTTRDRHVGSWFKVGNGRGQVTSIIDAATFVMDCTVTNWDLSTSAGANAAVGTGQTVYVPFASPGNAATVVGSDRDYGATANQEYLFRARTAANLAKQRGIDVSDHAAAMALFAAKNMPANPPSASDIGAGGSIVSANLEVRA